MLAVGVELRVLDGIKVVDEVVIALNGVMMVLGEEEEEGLPGEVMLEGGWGTTCSHDGISRNSERGGQNGASWGEKQGVGVYLRSEYV